MGRWTEVTPSPYAHEQEGLNQIKALLPDVAPFRAWSNVEFRDGQGKWHEVDLLVLGRRRLHLVELKHYRGVLRGDDLTWRRVGMRPEDSSLKLARRKAQRLASRLRDELRRRAQEEGRPAEHERDVLPYVQECVYLHAHDFRSQLPLASERDLFAPPGRRDATNLPSIADRLLEPAQPGEQVDERRERTTVELLQRIGLVQRRQREVGSWVIDDEPLAEGDGYQDWPAFHRVQTTDRARIRFQVAAPGASTEAVALQRRRAQHEHLMMSRLQHDGLLTPRDLVEDDLGVGLVYPADDRFRRLDLWLVEHSDGGLAVQTHLALLRQVAETLSYAHRRGIVHRGLLPGSVQVRDLDDGAVRTLVGDWQSAGVVPGEQLTGLGSFGSTGLADSTGGRLAGILAPGGQDEDRVRAEAFRAPEGMGAADRVRLDVFALGALAYYLLAGRAAATTRAGLRDRLQRDGGLDLAADLPQVPSALRAMVLDATRAAVSQRTADVRTFIEHLAEAEREAAEPEEVGDPLDAAPGALLAGRFELVRRLGAGSTAVGLLVKETTATGEAVRVLKVAVDDAAARRLDDEAVVLRGLDHARLVRLVEGPLRVGERWALLLSQAGEETLGDVLRTRRRLSLDLLERWGTDVLEALVELDRVGVTHRDVKPANLGVQERRGAKHLVLFDFSLARAAATSLTAGTAPYLDPFLEDPQRRRYDSAAERYAAAVVLFEMATGGAPVFGDGLSDPFVTGVEATVEAPVFDRAVADGLVAFFRRALARSSRQRHDTASDMLTAWRSVFSAVPATVHDDADALATAASPHTPLDEAGLSPRALSAVEQFGVHTAGDLAALDPMRLNAFSGVAEVTRREVKERARAWRERFAAAPAAPEVFDGAVADPVAGAALLAETAGMAGGRAARLLLGHEGGLPAFASVGQLAAALGVKRAKVSQGLAAAHRAWARRERTRAQLDAVERAAREQLDLLGGVATPDELAEAVRAALPGASGTSVEEVARAATGLLALALDREPPEGEPTLERRRRDGRVVLVAADPGLLDVAETAGRRTDTLVARSGEQLLLATAPAADLLRGPQGVTGLPDERVVQLGAALSRSAAVSGRGELHSRDLPLRDAVRLALAGLVSSGPAATVKVTAAEVRSRVRARFPALPDLPDRPQLDTLIDDAGLQLLYDGADGSYRTRQASHGTTGLADRPKTSYAPPPMSVADAHDQAAVRLRESMRSRSFLALGVPVERSDRVDLTVARLQDRYGAHVLDVTGLLVEQVRTGAAAVGLPWEQVLAADAAAAGSRTSQGLATLVRRALPALDEAIEAAEEDRPVLLTELGPLARYGHLGALARWADLSAPRRQAIWVLVPQLLGTRGAVVDGKPLPLAAPGQFLLLDPAGLAERPAVEAGFSTT